MYQILWSINVYFVTEAVRKVNSQLHEVSSVAEIYNFPLHKWTTIIASCKAFITSLVSCCYQVL